MAFRAEIRNSSVELNLQISDTITRLGYEIDKDYDLIQSNGYLMGFAVRNPKLATVICAMSQES